MCQVHAIPEDFLGKGSLHLAPNLKMNLCLRAKILAMPTSANPLHHRPTDVSYTVCFLDFFAYPFSVLVYFLSVCQPCRRSRFCFSSVCRCVCLCVHLHTKPLIRDWCDVLGTCVMVPSKCHVSWRFSDIWHLKRILHITNYWSDFQAILHGNV